MTRAVTLWRTGVGAWWFGPTLLMKLFNIATQQAVEVKVVNAVSYLERKLEEWEARGYWST